MAEGADSTPSDDDLERLLDNWGRWCRDLPSRGHCESIESRYRSPQTWYEPGAPQAPASPVDREAALAVNRAWGSVPQPWKGVLRDWYVYHANPAMTCRRLKIPRRAHDEYVHDARLMVRNLLTRNGWPGTFRPD